ncbi:hypothetical protein CHLNCDRAFT_133995 [Chlorella variabilis]|uniref:RRM domain-containing protein n=1 Tax=Chlorella variabilis TaxID=554065 RepID=E1ZER4_CHLVA|nr:hypothetical protein CHLNCDRAFT_133995 [Chlorella variabilis]EFN55703.1 hypothetical protein CHLNCDRAFT_133995 [Chlorella variabilis]|eukprot:XP_005847805.1 hypothetical protein CHLNCDRAFT_133995 [Chlorella variabilis]
MGSCAVLVDGIDAHTNCNELLALFSTAGTVMQAATISPAANGAPCTAILWFDTPASAASAVELFNDHPYAGTFLEVRPTDVGAATRALSALAEAQTTPPQAPAAQPLTAPSAAPAVAFASGAAVPMPAPFSVDASAPRPAAAPPPAPAALPEPPAFGDYNPDDWLPPPDWQSPAPAPGPAAGTTTAWARVATAAPAKAPPAGGQPAARKAQPAAGGAPMAPEWERDERCRIYIQNLKPGLSADDLRTSFSKFGPLVDTSVVPKQRIGFLTFAKGDDGERCLEAVNGTSVPGLSASGSEPLKLEFRNLNKIRRHLAKKRADVMEEPTTRVFIGYFPRNTKKEDVRTELSRYGELTELMLGGGEDGGELFCFVQFRRIQDAARAHRAIHSHTIPALAGSRQLIAAFKEPRR